MVNKKSETEKEKGCAEEEGRAEQEGKEGKSSIDLDRFYKKWHRIKKRIDRQDREGGSSEDGRNGQNEQESGQKENYVPEQLRKESDTEKEGPEEGAKPTKGGEKDLDGGKGERRVCSFCETTVTTLWRRVGASVVCNACGLYYKMHGKVRDASKAATEIKKRNRKKQKHTK